MTCKTLNSIVFIHNSLNRYHLEKIKIKYEGSNCKVYMNKQYDFFEMRRKIIIK